MPEGPRLGDESAVARCKSGVEVRTVPGGALLVDMTTGQCFRLNRTGEEMWALLQADTPVAAICRTLAEKYGLPAETVAKDIARLIEELRQASLVEPAGAP